VASAAELAKARMPQGATGFAVCTPVQKSPFKRDTDKAEMIVFERGDSKTDACEGLLSMGFAPETMANLAGVTATAKALERIAKARHGARHPETGRFGAKRAGLWEHGGGVLPSLLSHE
jgi:hypothetical protein